MKIKITAKRWDDPIVYECQSVTIREIAKGTAHSKVEVIPDSDGSGPVFELDPEHGEVLEIIS